MKNIAIISFIKSYNYGASLQGYALWHAITHILHFNGKCQYLNYRRDYKPDFIVWLARKISSAVLRRDDTPSYTCREILQEYLLARKDVVTYSDELERRFETFWNLMPYTEPVKKGQLRNLNEVFDTFIVGSDQVWNPGKVNLDCTYLLDFVSDGNKKFSYASSLGMKQIPLKYRKSYRTYLSRFNSISVREKASVGIIKELLSEDKNIASHCDPTLLLDFDAWNQISQNNKPDITNYVLVYDLTGKDKMCNQIANLIAEKRNLNVYTVSQENGHGPLEWLQLFINADYVVTNSFHGTAFSLNFSKEFIALIPQIEMFEKSKDRIFGILQGVGLDERVFSEKVFEEKTSDEIWNLLCGLKEIDTSELQSRLLSVRNEGLDYLRKCVND
ncbi:MAG: polysaccharide pyruvyl transferase family protein [Butyrivibrio sp.]|uniref:polysaccharide pyruvyl transferase family protein n=1 Tax=Butyrivibrio sp. TaxID=28121 RepID=UPI0025B8F9FE|nr:polysaccharide pyruvyl transferase family protein [Butyrivibrio sp.]MBQ6587217.1 polysaccharide pyruvyl transferase family protein [Butyrivibrio sp.]